MFEEISLSGLRASDKILAVKNYWGGALRINQIVQKAPSSELTWWGIESKGGQEYVEMRYMYGGIQLETGKQDRNINFQTQLPLDTKIKYTDINMAFLPIETFFDDGLYLSYACPNTSIDLFTPTGHKFIITNSTHTWTITVPSDKYLTDADATLVALLAYNRKSKTDASLPQHLSRIKNVEDTRDNPFLNKHDKDAIISILETYLFNYKFWQNWGDYINTAAFIEGAIEFLNYYSTDFIKIRRNT